MSCVQLHSTFLFLFVSLLFFFHFSSSKPSDVTVVDLDSGEIRFGETVKLPVIPSDLLTPIKTALIKVHYFLFMYMSLFSVPIRLLILHGNTRIY